MLIFGGIIIAPMYMRDVGLQSSPLVMSLSSFHTRVMLGNVIHTRVMY